MEVNFDKKTSIKGCNITAYLLEKSRVVKQGPNERNYHIFYMFLSGASKEMKKEFGLKPVDQFHYLTQSGSLEIQGRSDYQEFEEMMFAMDNLKIDLSTQHQIFQCLAAILHLGNLTFIDSKDVEGGSRVLAPADARKIASLLTVSEELLERALCNKDTLINGEPFLIPLNPEKAVDQRDSLAKYLYGKIFDFIILCVNSSLFRGKPGLSIGVLDIFGFEVFQLNSFEQLCINYCNERLQTFFNEIIFEGEMKMYSAEGLPVDDISYQVSSSCLPSPCSSFACRITWVA
jgi:myosin heavy subunit